MSNVPGANAPSTTDRSNERHGIAESFAQDGDVTSCATGRDERIPSGESTVDPPSPTPESGDEASSRTALSRRRLLTLGTVGVTSLSGCLDLLGTEDRPAANWRCWRRDPARTARAAAEAGPGRSLSVAWRRTVRDVAQHVLGAPVSTNSQDQGRWLVDGAVSAPLAVDDRVVSSVAFEIADDAGVEWWSGLVAFEPGIGRIRWYADVPLPVKSWRHHGFEPRYFPVPRTPVAIGGDVYVVATPPRHTDCELPIVISAVDLSSGGVVDQLALRCGDLGVDAVAEVLRRTQRLRSGTTAEVDTATGAWLVGGNNPDIRGRRFAIADGSVLTAEETSYDAWSLTSRSVTTGRIEWVRMWERFTRMGGPPEYVGVPTVADAPEADAPVRGYVGSGHVPTRCRESMTPTGSTLRSFTVPGGAERWQFRPPAAHPGHYGFPVTELPDCDDPGRYECGDRFSSVNGPPVVVGDTVVVQGTGLPAPGSSGSPCDRHIYAVDDTDGSVKWSVPGTAGHPVAAGRVIYVQFSDGVVWALGSDGAVYDRVTASRPTEPLAPAIGHGQLYLPARVTSSGASPNAIVAIE